MLRSPGQPLDKQTRDFFEPRFGHDFSNVRVHTDAKAAESAEALNALAYTVGRDIIFSAGKYIMGKNRGSLLIAHELAHTLQQGNVSATSQAELALNKTTDPTEDEAKKTADIALQDIRIPPKAVALQIRNKVRNSSLHKPLIQRAVKTWAGEWDTDKYSSVKTGGVDDGVDIELRFKPGAPVNATMIGMVQMVTSKDIGATVNVNPTVGARSLPAGTPGEGAHIDQLANFRNPLYATGAGGAADKLWDTPTQAQWGQHGYHYVDKTGVVNKKDAILKDTPQLPGHGANASQIFETTALAVTGVQSGTYYGSVRWGWKTNAAGAFSKIPLTKVSDDLPSGTFSRSQALWNKSTDIAGNALIKFYTGKAKFVNAPNTALVRDPNDPASLIEKLSKNVRVEVIDKGLSQPFNKGAAKVNWWKVTPVEGTAVGKVGWVMSNSLSDKVGGP